MVKCPNCRYEYVVRSRTIDLIKSVLSRWAPKGKATGAESKGKA